MPKTVDLTPAARDVLARASIEPLWVFLPTGKLDPAVYKAVDNFLKALGGKWNRSQQGHHFPKGTDGVAAAIAAGSAVDQKRTMEQFFTPPDIAESMCEIAGIGLNQLVLEPSAGAGAIALAALSHGARVLAVEKDSALMPDLLTLADRYPGRLRRVCDDFLTWSPGRDPAPFDDSFDAVLMNPPFGRGADMAHVTRALSFVRKGGVLVAVMSPHWTFASDRAGQSFRGLVNEHSHQWDPLPDGSFRASGTNVNTGILTIRKGQI